MSEFHRMITYLYLYEQGTKRHNVGFAKIEKRDKKCLIEIHMKNTGHNTPSAPVYFYARNNQTLPGILLGTIGLSRGNGDFKTILKEEPLAGSGYPLEDIKGIFIPLSEEIMFVSQWDDNEFVRENFVEPSKEPPAGKDSGNGNAAAQAVPAGRNAAAQASPSNRNPAAQASPADRNPAAQASPANRNPAAQASPADRNPAAQAASADRNTHTQTPASSRNPSQQTASSNKNVSQQNTPAGNHPPSLQDATPERASSAAPVPPPSADLKAAEAAPKQTQGIGRQNPFPAPFEQTQETLPENWDQKWSFILENYPVMTPFAGDENTICVRLELKDIRLLPRPYWYLGNNSFLLHGFFNYRYLILGATEKAGKKRWFIGIPGVYQNPERVMATLFGFPEFRNEKSVPVNTGEFGYWYRYLNR